MGSVVGSVDRPSEPEETGRIEHAGDGGADRVTQETRELPDPNERGRVYEATRARVEAKAGEEAEPGRRADGNDQRSYRAEVPHFVDMGADHEKRPPADRQPAADRSASPPGSYRSDTGFSRSQERQAKTAEAMGRVREAEPAISADVRTIERENKYGGWLEGLEFRLKGEDRLKEKVDEKLKAEPRMTAAEALREVPDAIRYTYCFQPGNYARGYYDIKERLESRGYEMYFSKNWWTNPEYKGINTRWVTPDGQRFEVQVHTPDSFHAKHSLTHAAYERIRDPMISDRERRELRNFQREVSSAIRVPDGATDIPDYRKEGF